MSQTGRSKYPSARYLGDVFLARYLADPSEAGSVPERRLAPDARFNEAVIALDGTDAVGIPLGDGWGTIRRESADRIIFRCWLFGLITLVEMRLRDELERMGSGRWRQLLSPDRVEKAREMKARRQALRQETDTIHNLQFGDLGIIAVRDDEIFEAMHFESKKKAKEFVRELERLRNNLAHSQEIARWNWPTIVRIAEISGRIIAASAAPPAGNAVTPSDPAAGRS